MPPFAKKLCEAEASSLSHDLPSYELADIAVVESDASSLASLGAFFWGVALFFLLFVVVVVVVAVVVVSVVVAAAAGLLNRFRFLFTVSATKQTGTNHTLS